MQKTKIQFDKNVKTTNLNFQIGKDFQKWLYLGVIWARKESRLQQVYIPPQKHWKTSANFWNQLYQNFEKQSKI